MGCYALYKNQNISYHQYKIIRYKSRSSNLEWTVIFARTNWWRPHLMCAAILFVLKLRTSCGRQRVLLIRTLCAAWCLYLVILLMKQPIVNVLLLNEKDVKGKGYNSSRLNYNSSVDHCFISKCFTFHYLTGSQYVSFYWTIFITFIA